MDCRWKNNANKIGMTRRGRGHLQDESSIGVQINRGSILVNLTIAVIAATLLWSCFPDSQETDQLSENGEIASANIEEKFQITERVVGGNKLYVPNVYLSTSYTSLGDDSGLLQAYYPGSTPIPDDPQSLWEQGEWYKNVRILFTYPPKPDPAGVMASMITLNRADLKAGEKYGLRHYTQSDVEQRIFRKDIWIEDDTSGSFIMCSKKQADNEVPLCQHIFSIGDASIKIRYNKQLLPDWEIIKENVSDMYESFFSKESALIYVQNLISQDGGGQ